jgi:Class II flagellar assembly regulator
MRIVGPNGTGRVANASAARRGASGGFSIEDNEAAKPSAPSISLRTIGGIDALLALQSENDPREQRKRALGRGRTALDALDELKVEVLSGTLGLSTLTRLKSATTDIRESSGDPGLDKVLAEIELRVEVEIAKLTPRR